jgi:hypothetical protein
MWQIILTNVPVFILKFSSTLNHANRGHRPKIGISQIMDRLLEPLRTISFVLF